MHYLFIIFAMGKDERNLLEIFKSVFLGKLVEIVFGRGPKLS